MTTGGSRIIAGELGSPEPVADGEVVDRDEGVPGSIVLAVRRGDGEVFRETYELVRVESESDLRSE